MVIIHDGNHSHHVHPLGENQGVFSVLVGCEGQEVFSDVIIVVCDGEVQGVIPHSSRLVLANELQPAKFDRWGMIFRITSAGRS